MLIGMAFQNVFRNKRRTLLTATAIFIGLLLLMNVTSWNEGYKTHFKNIFVNTDTGALKIMVDGYPLDKLTNPIDHPILNYQELTRYLDHDQDIKTYEPRIQFNSSLNNGIDEVKANGIGIVPTREEALFQRTRDISEGRFLQSDEEGIVLGAELAKILAVGVGDTITVVAKASQMGFNAYDLEIVGLLRTGNPAIDNHSFFLPLAFTQELLSLEGITEIAAELKAESRLSAFQTNLLTKKFAEKVSVYPWQDFAKDLLNYIEYRQKVINFLTGIILIMAAAGILNTMLMAMLERKKEIGILMSMGVTNTEIMKLFLIEGTIIGLLGSISAVVLGLGMIGVFHHYGLPASMGSTGDSPVLGKLYPYLSIPTVLWFFVLGVLLATLAAVYPAFKSSRIQPIEAISGMRRK